MKIEPARIVRSQFLSGPNRYCDCSCLLIGVAFQDRFDKFPGKRTPHWDNLSSIALVTTRLSIGRLAKGALPASGQDVAVDQWALEIASRLLQRFLIRPLRGTIFGNKDGVVLVLLPTEDMQLGLAAWKLADQIVYLLLSETADEELAVDLADCYEQFVHLGRRHSFGQMPLAIARAADALDIPVYRYYPAKRIHQLGQGRFRHLSFETMADGEFQVAVQLSHDKAFTNQCLRQVGLPTLRSEVVMTEERALQAARKIGGPVVVKPVHGGKGKGVSVALASDREISEAYALAASLDPQVLVERYVAGDDFRLLVVGGKLIAAAKRIPAQIIGDGRSTVAELIDQINEDPRRGATYETLMERITIDAALLEMLARQATKLDAVLPPGKIVKLSLVANISQGGEAIDVTDEVHPDNRSAVERAVKVSGLSVVGVDFIAPDISRSWREAGGWILELNCPPGLRPHWIADSNRDVATPIVRHSFPEGAPARMPTVGVTGSVGKTTTCQMIASIARAAGRSPGVSTSQGLWSGDSCVARQDMAGGDAALQLMLDPTIDIGVFEFARGGLLKKGMVIDGVDVGVVLNVHGNHVHADGIASREELADIKSILARSARQWVLLNAEDPLVLGMRSQAKAPVGLVSIDPANPAVAAHRETGGYVAVVDDVAGTRAIRLIENGETILGIPIAAIPASRGGQSRAITTNALFAAAASYKLGLSPESIVEGLTGFTSDAGQNPGRHNRIAGFPFEVELHWTDGAIAMADLVETLRHDSPDGRRLLYLTSPGNRSDEWLRELGRAAAGHFDRYICADFRDLRGREPGSTPALLADGLRSGGAEDAAITTFAHPDRPLGTVVEEMQPGDKLVIVTYETDDALATLERTKSRDRRSDVSGGAVPISG
jgi:cyanophycin synthetase